MPCELKFYLFTEHQLEQMLTTSHTVGFLDGWKSAECTYAPDNSFLEISKSYAYDVIKELRENENNDDVDPPWTRRE